MIITTIQDFKVFESNTNPKYILNIDENLKHSIINILDSYLSTDETNNTAVYISDATIDFTNDSNYSISINFINGEHLIFTESGLTINGESVEFNIDDTTLEGLLEYSLEYYDHYRNFIV